MSVGISPQGGSWIFLSWFFLCFCFSWSWNPPSDSSLHSAWLALGLGTTKGFILSLKQAGHLDLIQLIDSHFFWIDGHMISTATTTLALLSSRLAISSAQPKDSFLHSTKLATVLAQPKDSSSYQWGLPFGFGSRYILQFNHSLLRRFLSTQGHSLPV